MNLSNHNITDNDIENTLRYLNIFPSITNIDLSNNLIGNEGAKAIITALEKNKKIEEINLNGNQNISPTYLNKLNELLPKPTPSENLPRCRCHIL